MQKRFAGCKTQAEKCQFYYEVFLLDPDVSTKEVHKESLQKHSSLQRQVEGWMTEWEVGKLEGADPSLPNFESLCKAAVAGLPSRPHEVEAWASQGLKQYWYSKQLHKETLQKNSSQTKAKEYVGQLENEPFRQVEEALKVAGGPQTLMLGNKAEKAEEKPSASNEGKERDQPEEGSLYRKAVQNFRKAANAYSTASNKVTTLLARLDKAPEEIKKDPQFAVSRLALADLETSSSKERGVWNAALAAYPATLEAGADEEAKVEELKLEKSNCDKALKELNKALAPTKVWAKDRLE